MGAGRIEAAKNPMYELRLTLPSGGPSGDTDVGSGEFADVYVFLSQEVPKGGSGNGGSGSGGGGRRVAKAKGKSKSPARKAGPLPIGFYTFTDWEAARQVRADGQVVASEAIFDSFKFTNRQVVCRRLRLPRSCMKPAMGGAKGQAGEKGGEGGAEGDAGGVVLLLPCTYEAKQEGTFTIEAMSADANLELLPVTDIPKPTIGTSGTNTRPVGQGGRGAGRGGGRGRGRGGGRGRGRSGAAPVNMIQQMATAKKGMGEIGSLYAGLDL